MPDCLAFKLLSSSTPLKSGTNLPQDFDVARYDMGIVFAFGHFIVGLVLFLCKTD